MENIELRNARRSPRSHDDQENDRYSTGKEKRTYTYVCMYRIHWA